MIIINILIIIITIFVIVIITIICRQHTDSTSLASGKCNYNAIHASHASNASRCAQVLISHIGCSGEHTCSVMCNLNRCLTLKPCQ